MEQQTGAGAVLAGRYRLVEPIGSGGMGKVWRAHDELLHRTVAVKELTAGLYVAQADREVLHARTQKEARAAARIQHPAVVVVHDVLEHDDRPWIVMEYIDGPSLADAAKAAGRIEPAEAARIGLHVLGALRAAHAVGVLHRDVKPGNVLLAKDGRVLLTDFGIAAIEGDSSITRTGEIVGSIDYLAPERVTGGTPGTSSDLWSLGATLYTAGGGRAPPPAPAPPHTRTPTPTPGGGGGAHNPRGGGAPPPTPPPPPISSLQAVVNDEPPALRQAGALGPVITALLRKDPDERPSAQETERMLIEAMEGRQPKAAQAYVPTRAVTPEELADAAEEPAPEAAPAPAAASEQVRTAALPEQARPPAEPTGGWIKRAAAVALVAALVGGGAVFGVLKFTGEDTGNGGGDKNASAPDRQDGVEEAAPPAGFTKVVDPLAGFTLFVPEGWTRKANGDQIDYTPDDGKHFIRIASDPTPDYRDPYAHLLDLETQVAKRTDYKKVRLNQNTFRDSTRAALWEFTYTEKQTHPGPRRAKEQMYIAPDGTEYAVYISSPTADWATIEQQFDVALSGWKPPAAKP
ncbi:serine/threonine-protein kinase [Streptomyces vinaceus]|uniref:serine/threonine-protein kinase n=1 Tax=Streptomyces vinaceus TaxID=1960 RepID=UPI0036B122B9